MNRMFSKEDLRKMIVPLLFEQLLILVVGMADTFMVSHAGEDAVSGVSLVNNFNTIFIYIFTALASGGAVIISQYLGKDDKKNANKAASQLLTFSVLVSLGILLFVLLFKQQMLSLVFGKVEQSVMDACLTYLTITALSYPAMAIYNAGASSFRSMGKTKVTMYVSIITNLINVVGNYIGVFILKAGVAGVAWPTFISYVFSAIIISYLCSKKENEVSYDLKDIFTIDGKLIKSIMVIAVPNSLEGAVFQIVKVALSSIVALFGTYQIAANGVAQSIWSLAALSGQAMNPVFITVIGQTMGANKVDEAEYYFKHLTKIAMAIAVVWCAITLALTPLFLTFTGISQEAKSLTFILVLIHNIFCAFVSPFNCIGSGLRAAGDVKYTMYVSIFATICVRLVLSYLLAYFLNMGVIGIAFAMCIDWCARAILFIIRIKNEKWKQFKLI
jgi:putative MATE family efflux protein